MRVFDYFDRVYIINLAERTDRRAEMLEELAQAKIELKQGHVEFFPAIRAKEKGEFPTLGARGCFHSHLECWKKAKAEGAKTVLVIEDDLQIAPRFVVDEHRLVEQLQSLPWDIVYFGHALDTPSDQPSELVPFDGGIILAHFYGLNEAYRDQLIEFFEQAAVRRGGHPDGGPMYPDAGINFYRAKNPGSRTLVARPNLGTQRSSRSDVTPKWHDRVVGLKSLVGLARRVKRKLVAR